MDDLLDLDGPQQPQQFYNMRLPSFWVDKPASWFVLAESRFRLHGVADEQRRFDLLLSSLSKESLSMVMDVIERPDLLQPYTTLRDRLLAAHQLSDYQRIARLHKMEPLGARKPSELLAAMLVLCPRGHEDSIFFVHLFLERLPAELRVLLGEDDHQDPRALAEKADRLWAMHGQRFGMLAALEPSEPPVVAAVSGRGRDNRRGRGGRGRNGGGGQSGHGGGGSAAAQGASASAATNPVDLARIQSGLCFYHWSFGEKANRCTAPCAWGN
jgi:hypothetical protein